MLNFPFRFVKQYNNWKKSESEFAIFVDKWKSKINIDYELNGNCAIIIQPWMMTATPWFLIAMALYFTQKNMKVTIILDDFKFGNKKILYSIQLRSILKILLSLPGSIKTIQLSKIKGKVNKTDIDTNSLIYNLSLLNEIHFMRGAMRKEGRKKYHNTILKQLKKTYKAIDKLFNANHFEFIVLAGGIWGSSGVFLKLAESYKIRGATFDSGFGTILLNTMGIAAHQSDIPTAFYQLEEIHTEIIQTIARNEMERRKLGIDNFCTQPVSYEDAKSAEKIQAKAVGILILLNIPWDSAALGLDPIFTDTTEWIIESIRWTLNNTNEVITIRQHPHERTASGKSNDDYEVLIKQHFGNINKIKFISANEKINTYNLIENSRLVISFSTTASMEATAMGKVVINISRCYYSDLGFVYSPKNKKEYFTYIKDTLNGEISVSAKQKENALKCYYLSQCCNRINTIFTPQPTDFKKWVKKNPEDIFQLEEVKNYFDSIENGIPLSLINHNNKMKKLFQNQLENLT